MKNNLPAPHPIAKGYSERLQALLAEEIRQKGPMNFAEFMQKALYEPGLGYYSAGARKIGADGDFVTAPEISPLFSRCVANQCEQIISKIPGASILELGAGTGVMAKEILLYLQAKNNLPTHYFILEVSADLRERQQRLLSELAPELFNRVQWLENLPEHFSGIILANEVLDAMPVNKFYVNDKIYEFYVDFSQDQFTWKLVESKNKALIDKISALNLNSDYESEMNLLLAPWIRSLAEILQQGVVLIIDYGFPASEYYHADRNRGTIMCHFQHRAHSDPLIHVGIQDITAHVDFTAIAEAASDCGFCVEGFTNQAAFLFNCGLMDFYPESDELAQYRVSQEIKKLTLPSEMGELFKVMALSKDFEGDLRGFSMMNRVGKL